MATKRALGVLLLLVGVAVASWQPPPRFPVEVGVDPYALDNALCPVPGCATQEQIETLWGIVDPSYFLQCRPQPDGSWELELMPCAPATWFHFRIQVCVEPDLWEACDGTEGGVTTTLAPPETPEPPPPETPAPPAPETPAPPVTTTADPDDVQDPCGGPRCNTYEEINTLWVHPRSDYFYQCRPMPAGNWAPQEMPCAPGTLFSFVEQVCVHAWDWIDVCPDDGTGETTTINPPDTPVPPPTPAPPTPAPPTPEPPPVTGEPPQFFPDCLVPNCGVLQDDVIRFPTRDGPQLFYRCQLVLGAVWMPILDSCPPGLYFFFNVQDCVAPVDWIDLCALVPDDVTTTQITTEEPPVTEQPPPWPVPVICGSPRCSTDAERALLWPSTVADLYYRCVWNQLMAQWVPRPERCTDFFFFDFLGQRCVFPTDWVDICPIYPTLPPNNPPCPDCCPTCPPPAEPPVTTETPGDPGDQLPLPIICGAPRCGTEQERTFRWPANDANEYYVCVDTGAGWMQATLQQCPAGLLFNTLDQDCVTVDRYDPNFCPVFPPPPAPPAPAGPTTPAPPVTVCFDGFDPTPALPIVCDQPRCNTAETRAILWPAFDTGSYFVCPPGVTSGTDAVLTRCPTGQTFHFFSQCCRAPTAGEDPPPPSVCPVFPLPPTAPPTVPPPTLPPVPSVCSVDFDPTPLVPVTCDSPRCASALERSVLWPSAEVNRYYLCFQQLPDVYEPVQQTCPAGQSFDFVQQCCIDGIPPVDACSLFRMPIPNEATLPLPIVCGQPRCGTEQERNFFWPDTDRMLLYACQSAPGGERYEPLMYTCPAGQAFHVWKQDCVAEDEWINLCPVFSGLGGGGNHRETTAPPTGPILTPPTIG